MDLRGIMFQNVYTQSWSKRRRIKSNQNAEKAICILYRKSGRDVWEYRLLMKRGESKAQVVCDYLSGMTDQYSMAKFRKIFIPKSWEVY